MRYICSYCNTFVYDEKIGDTRANLPPGTTLKNISELWACPVCGQKKSFLKQIDDEDFEEKRAEYEKLYPLKSEDKKDLIYYRNIARQKLAGVCAVNKVCDGNPDRLCMGQKYGKAIGFGGAGKGTTFNANFKALERYKLKMRVIRKHHEPDMETNFLDHKIKMPLLVTSMSGVKISMNDTMPEADFQRAMVEGAKNFGTIGMSGNTVEYPEHPGVEVIKSLGGYGIPVFKPQSQEKLLELFKRAEKADVLAIGVDLDGYGSTNWALRGKPVYRKSEDELRELVKATKKPIIFKGIMSVEDAKIVYDVGAKAVDISNHGGRVMDCGLGVADVLPDIADELKGKITIMADGAVRTGFDVLKILALGADVTLTGREVGRMAIAGGSDAVKMHLDYIKNDFRQAMLMTGCNNLKEINRDILIKQ